ncbi:MAG TPA: cyclic nucleotide-binding domain-containing protein [Candidatus Cloacimonadota bacterium]|nr:cyclic nucleotide-binding domain-containing protein [Candidatus Cloacimonadota bacterium]HQB41827.1 cyclic nucleotide-binding domain-containing protein [Candidatus Cloacimonadota bacterium]
MIDAIKNLFKDNSNTTKLANIKLFKNLNKTELSCLSNYLIERKFSKGDIIYQENYPHVVIYFILEGNIELYFTKNGVNKTFENLTTNQHFGEIGLFDDNVRINSAKAITDCSLLAISKYDFVKFASKYPGSGIKLLYNLAEEVVRNYYDRLKNELE